MTPQQMAALGQHASKTADQSRKAADESLAAAQMEKAAAEVRKKAADDYAKRLKESAEAEKAASADRARHVRALDAATRLFSTNLTQLPGMVLRNLTTGKSPLLGLNPGEKAPAGAVMGGMAAAFLSTFGKILSDGFKTLLAQPTSGAQTMHRAFEMLAMSVAPVLLPSLFLLGVAALAASDIIFAELTPAVGGLADIILTQGIPAVVALVGSIRFAANTIRLVLGTLSSIGTKLGIPPLAGPGSSPLIGPPTGRNGERASGAVREAIADMLTELKTMAMRTPLASGGPASVYTRAQTAVLGESPLEKKKLDRLFTIIGLLERLLGKYVAPARTNERAAGAVIGGVAGAMLANK